MAKRASSETVSSCSSTIRITNGKIKGYHIFRIKCAVGTEVDVRREADGLDDKALLCHVSRDLPEEIANTRVSSRSSGRSHKMCEVEGRPMGRVQYFLNKTFVDLIEEGKALEIKGLITGDPTTTKAPPQNQKWLKNRQEGGGAYTPCEWNLKVRQSSLETAVEMIKATLNNVEEGASMEVKVDGGNAKRLKASE